jgi:hypothetical protein
MNEELSGILKTSASPCISETVVMHLLNDLIIHY